MLTILSLHKGLHIIETLDSKGSNTVQDTVIERLLLFSWGTKQPQLKMKDKLRMALWSYSVPSKTTHIPWSLFHVIDRRKVKHNFEVNV